jgi:hypothetical protein
MEKFYHMQTENTLNQPLFGLTRRNLVVSKENWRNQISYISLLSVRQHGAL